MDMDLLEKEEEKDINGGLKSPPFIFTSNPYI